MKAFYVPRWTDRNQMQIKLYFEKKIWDKQETFDFSSVRKALCIKANYSINFETVSGGYVEEL